MELRKNFNHKLCLKKKKYLNLKHTPSNALSTRLMKKGNFLKSYKMLKYFFYRHFLIKKFKTIPMTSNFLFFYSKYFSFRDLDRVLMWKYNQLDCMFNSKVKKLKKKKQQLSKLVFIVGVKRLVLCMNFIKYIILLNCRRKKKNMTHNLFTPLYNYIVYDKNNLVIKVKYRIYKQKLMQLQT